MNFLEKEIDEGYKSLPQMNFLKKEIKGTRECPK